jgi:hypothetical protein
VKNWKGIFTIILSGVLLAFVLLRRESKRDFYEGLPNAKDFNEIFEKVGEINLLPKGFIYGSLFEGVILSDSSMALLDVFSNSLLKFSKNGNFIHKIGAVGDGPGEYRRPAKICKGGNDDIYLFDSSELKIVVYDSSGRYKYQFRLSGYISRMVVNDFGLYVQKFDPEDKMTIDHYSFQGKFKNSFSEMPNEHRNFLIQFSAGGGLVSDLSGNLYQIIPTKFEIKKFNPKGKLIKKFGKEPRYYRGYGKRLPDLSDRKVMQRLVYEKTLIYNLFFLEPKFLLVQLVNHDEKMTPTSYIELYDTDGNFVNGGIKIPFLITFTWKNMICFVNPIESKLILYRIRWRF